MSVRRAMTLVAVFVGFLAIDIGSAHAQPPLDCGTTCKQCGGGTYREGDSPLQSNGQFSLDCDHTNCVFCGSERISDGTPDATAILDEQVQAAPVADLGAIVTEFGERLLLNADRNLLVVQGSPCDPRALVSVLFVPVKKVTALKRLGVRTLADFASPETDSTS